MTIHAGKANSSSPPASTIRLQLVAMLAVLTVGVAITPCFAEDKIWFANGAGSSPHTNFAGPYQSSFYWDNYSAPKTNDNIYFHSGAYRPLFSGGVEHAPPRSIVFGDMTLRYTNENVDYQGQDRTINNITVVRGDFRFALGGQTLNANNLWVRKYFGSGDDEGRELPSSSFILRGLPNHSSPAKRSLTLSNGNVLLDGRVSIMSEGDFPAELRVEDGANLELTKSFGPNETAVFVSSFFEEGKANDSTLTVDGAGSRMLVYGGKVEAAGSVIVSDGANFTTGHSSWDLHKSLLVDNSTLHATGAEGRLRLHRHASSRFSSNAEILLGGQFVIDGNSTIEGGSTLSSSAIGNPLNSSGLVGQFGPAVVSVTGKGSAWNQDGELIVAAGDMIIDNGGSVNSLSGVIGRYPAFVGRVIVDGSHRQANWTLEESLIVGGNALSTNGTGKLLVQDKRALVDIGTTLLIRDGSSAIIEGGAIMRTGYLNERPVRKEVIAGNPSRLSVHAGSSVLVQPEGFLRVGAEGSLPTEMASEGLAITSDGHLGGDGIIIASSVFNAGIVSPGSLPTNSFLHGTQYEPGTLTIDGDYEQDVNGILELEVRGTNLGEYDVLNVLGEATIAGQVAIRFVDGYVPEIGDTWDFLISDPVDISAFSIGAASVAEEVEFVFSGLPSTHIVGSQLSSNTNPEGYNAISFEVNELLVVPLAGDYNNDGIVDAADHTVWRDNLGSDSAALNGNGNETGMSFGIVDQADYAVWKANFGATTLSAASSLSVPEPNTLSLCAFVAVGLLCQRFCKRSKESFPCQSSREPRLTRHDLPASSWLKDSRRYFLVRQSSMLAKHILIALGAVGICTANAATLEILDGGSSGTSYLWEVQLTPDSASSVALEIGFEFSGGRILNITPNLNAFDTLNPGQNPFSRTVTFGTSIHDVLATDDGAFVALGGLLSTVDPVEALTIETDQPGTMRLGGHDHNGFYVGSRVSQNGINTDALITSLTIEPRSSADFNMDSTVNGTDLDIWKSSYGNPADGTTGDADGDGLATGNDFLFWQRQFEGNGSPIESPGTAVPEPATMTLLLFSLVIIAVSHKKSS